MRGRQEALAAEVAAVADDAAEVVLLAAAPADWWQNGCNRRLLLGEKHCRRRVADDKEAHLLNMVDESVANGAAMGLQGGMLEKLRKYGWGWGDPMFAPL